MLWTLNELKKYKGSLYTSGGQTMSIKESLYAKRKFLRATIKIISKILLQETF